MCVVVSGLPALAIHSQNINLTLKTPESPLAAERGYWIMQHDAQANADSCLPRGCHPEMLREVYGLLSPKLPSTEVLHYLQHIHDSGSSYLAVCHRVQNYACGAHVQVYAGSLLMGYDLDKKYRPALRICCCMHDA